jgi:hypothetical protein
LFISLWVVAYMCSMPREQCFATKALAEHGPLSLCFND